MQVELTSEVISLLKQHRDSYKDGILNRLNISDTKAVNALLVDKLKQEIKRNKKP